MAQTDTSGQGSSQPATKGWQTSLTVQGAMVAGAAPLVAQYLPMVLHLVGFDPTQAADLAHGLSVILIDAGAFMAVIGRARLGGLH